MERNWAFNWTISRSNELVYLIKSSRTHLLIVLVVLAVEVSFQRQLRSARSALEAADMEECEVLQRADSVHLVDDFFASKACWLVKIRSVHLVHNIFSFNPLCQYIPSKWGLHLDHHYPVSSHIGKQIFFKFLTPQMITQLTTPKTQLFRRNKHQKQSVHVRFKKSVNKIVRSHWQKSTSDCFPLYLIQLIDRSFQIIEQKRVKWRVWY